MGYKRSIFENGLLVEVIDDRIFEEEQHRRILENKELCQIDIDQNAPLFKQVNALAKIEGRDVDGYDAEKAQSILDYVNQRRERCNQIEQRLLAASNLEELDAVENG